MTDQKNDKSTWAVGGGILIGIGVGFFFLQQSALAFVGSMLAGLGLMGVQAYQSAEYAEELSLLARTAVKPGTAVAIIKGDTAVELIGIAAYGRFQDGHRFIPLG